MCMICTENCLCRNHPSLSICYFKYHDDFRMIEVYFLLATDIIENSYAYAYVTKVNDKTSLQRNREKEELRGSRNFPAYLHK